MALWGHGPEAVLLVYNESSSLSKSIAAYYAERRHIPEANHCRLKTDPVEEIERETYVGEIEEPVRHCLQGNRLVDRVSYIVTTAGVPLKIRGAMGQRATAAAVDSELTLLYARMKGDRFAAGGFVPNPFYRKRDEAFRRPQFPIYLVTRLAAYRLETVRSMIDRCLEARNTGRVVIDMHSGSEQDGESWLRTAAVLLPKGRVLLEETYRPVYGERRVIGYASWGSNDGNRKERHLGFRWLPGAIVIDFVSTNGRTFERPPDDWTFGNWQDNSTYFAGSPQSLAADYLEEGASGAAGHVYEPFLELTARPEYVFPAYLRGRNLAESYYLGMPALSWMNIVLGDPLCQLAPQK